MRHNPAQFDSIIATLQHVSGNPWQVDEVGGGHAQDGFLHTVPTSDDESAPFFYLNTQDEMGDSAPVLLTEPCVLGYGNLGEQRTVEYRFETVAEALGWLANPAKRGKFFQKYRECQRGQNLPLFE